MEIVALIRLLVVLLLIALAVILLTRRLAVPYTLGLVIVGLLISLSGRIPDFHLTPDLVLFVFLPALLFEGAWAMSIPMLRENWKTIVLLAGPGLLLELVLIAVPLRFLAGIDWQEALLLAAILSPTDPVAVLGLFRQLRVNEQLSTIIEGESLFNDGVAGALYHLFLAFALLAMQKQQLTGGEIVLEGLGIFALQAGGGLLIGGLCGFLVSRFVRYLDDALLETTITLITAYGVYLLADAINASGILAVIIAGLILGSYGRTHGMSERTLAIVDGFWSMIAFLANALLFLLVGVQLNPSEFLTSDSAWPLLLTALITIVTVLLARLVMVLLLPRGQAPRKGIGLRSWRVVIFWSGLRGALSLALVLALPLDMPNRYALIFSTYAVILFTLLVQGLSLRWLLRRLPAVSIEESVV